MNDQSLGDTTPDQPAPSSTMTPFGDPTGTTRPAQADDVITPPASARQWTIEEILNTAKTPERHARVCLRADLEAEHDLILSELAGLVDARGQVLDDEERPVGVPSKAARAQQLLDRDEVVRGEMANAMWYPLFRGLTSDGLTAFNDKHLPKKDGADMTEYHTLLIAECSIASEYGPKLSVDDVRRLRQELGSAALGAMTRAARDATTKGGTDFPQLPAGWARLKEQ